MMGCLPAGRDVEAPAYGHSWRYSEWAPQEASSFFRLGSFYFRYGRERVEAACDWRGRSRRRKTLLRLVLWRCRHVLMAGAIGVQGHPR
jgi:hypothetical protein